MSAVSIKMLQACVESRKCKVGLSLGIDDLGYEKINEQDAEESYYSDLPLNRFNQLSKLVNVKRVIVGDISLREVYYY